MLKVIARRLRRSEEGFTLIELLVVVAIIALLATFAVPKLFDAINKSKKAPGQADMQTISAALDRYYLDNNAYPNDPDAADVMAALAPYLKNTTTYKNGFGQGYFYGTTTTGAGYVLLDAQGAAAALTDFCGNTAADWTPGANFTVINSFTTAQLAACATPANMAMTTN